MQRVREMAPRALRRPEARRRQPPLQAAGNLGLPRVCDGPRAPEATDPGPYERPTHTYTTVNDTDEERRAYERPTHTAVNATDEERRARGATVNTTDEERPSPDRDCGATGATSAEQKSRRPETDGTRKRPAEPDSGAAEDNPTELQRPGRTHDRAPETAV